MKDRPHLGLQALREGFPHRFASISISPNSATGTSTRHAYKSIFLLKRFASGTFTRRSALFPRGSLYQVISRTSSDAVAHASLIFHHHCYNPLIAAWYDKLRTPMLFAVVG